MIGDWITEESETCTASAEATRLLPEVEALIDSVEADAARRMQAWAERDLRPEFLPSAENLAAYLALRHFDLRKLQRELMALGLSALGNLESRVLPTLEAVHAALAALAGRDRPARRRQADFFAGDARLERRATALFGEPRAPRHAAMLVTCPDEAAEDGLFMEELAERGVEALRINCAHHDAAAWARMIAFAQSAATRSGRGFKVMMDLAGPKIRTGAIRPLSGKDKLFEGDRLAIVPPGGLDAPLPAGPAFAAECTHPDVVPAVSPGQRLFIKDGKIHTLVESVTSSALIARVTRCKPGGASLKPEKGINLPDTLLPIPALSARDREDLAFVAAHADAVAFSFVQRGEDITLLQDALAELRPDDWQDMPLILKIETAEAVRNLPELIVRAGARQPVAIMIARGDLAIEIGFARLAEMQEEILWIAEAAHVPVIWATQVLQQLVKTGIHSRGELTDAAMAVRADCVMLNKGPYVLEAIDALDHLLGRMEGHMHKRTPQLRPLASW